MKTTTTIRLGFLLSGLLAVGGCGDDGGGGGADAGDGVDASDVDAAPSTATCGLNYQVSSASERAGVLVSFNAPDGSLIGTAITDVDGIASRDDCVADTALSLYVSAFAGQDGLPGTLITIAGVQPGDTVAFGGLFEEGGSPGPTAVNAAIASDVGALSDPGSYDYKAPGCPSLGFIETAPGEFETFSANESCIGYDGNVHLVARAFSEPLVGYAVGVAAANPGGSVAMTVGPWVAASTPSIEVTLSNAPLQASGIEQDFLELRSGVRFSGFSNTVDVESLPFTQPYGAGFPLGSMLTHELNLLVYFGIDPGVFNFRGDTLPPGGIPDVSIGLAKLGQTPAETHSVDLAATLLPRIAGAFGSTPDGPSRPLVQWFADGDLSVADGVVITTIFGEGFPENTVSPRGAWIVLSPDAGRGTYQYPSLPDSLVGFAPRANENITIFQAAAFDYDWLDYSTIITTEAGIALSVIQSFGDAQEREPIPPPGDTYSKRVSYYLNGQVLETVFESCDASATATSSSKWVGMALLLAMVLVGRRRRGRGSRHEER